MLHVAEPTRTESNCAYTHLTYPTQVTPTSRYTHTLLNSGLVVFTPSRGILNNILELLYTSPLVQTFSFPDQDGGECQEAYARGEFRGCGGLIRWKGTLYMGNMHRMQWETRQYQTPIEK